MDVAGDDIDSGVVREVRGRLADIYMGGTTSCEYLDYEVLSPGNTPASPARAPRA